MTSKFAKKSTSSDINATWYNVRGRLDETFMTIWLSRSSEVRIKVRIWPQSPFGTIFLPLLLSLFFLFVKHLTLLF